MGLHAISLTLSEAQLSDLFFNFDHPERDRLYSERKPGRSGVLLKVAYDDEYKAIWQDAREFVGIIGESMTLDDRTQLIEFLAEDFMRRR